MKSGIHKGTHPMFTIAIRLDPETRSKLELLARVTGQSHAFLVAEAVRRFVDTELSALAAEVKKEQARQADNHDGAPERWNIIV